VAALVHALPGVGAGRALRLGGQREGDAARDEQAGYKAIQFHCEFPLRGLMAGSVDCAALGRCKHV
jgi:hypothetical protein